MSGFYASVWFSRKIGWVRNVQPLLKPSNFLQWTLPCQPFTRLSFLFFQEGLEMRLNICVAVPLTQGIKMPWITMANVVPISMVLQPKYICSTATSITRIGAVDMPGLVRPTTITKVVRTTIPSFIISAWRKRTHGSFPPSFAKPDFRVRVCLRETSFHPFPITATTS